jgi:hypothetical protein
MDLEIRFDAHGFGENVLGDRVTAGFIIYRSIKCLFFHPRSTVIKSRCKIDHIARPSLSLGARFFAFHDKNSALKQLRETYQTFD